MAAEQFITNAYSAIVSWTYILIVILIVAKIIQFFSGKSLLGNTGGGGGDDDTGSNGKKKKKPKPEEEEEDDKKKFDKKEGESHGVAGNIKVIVQDISRTGLPGVLVKIYPRLNRGPNAFVRKFRLAVIKAPYQKRTDNNGVTTFEGVPAGDVIFELFKEGHTFARAGVMRVFSVTRGRNRYFWSQMRLQEGKDELVTFTFGREGEEAHGFEPVIENVRFRHNQNGEPQVQITGRVD
ncbi:hypothetical protein JW756_00595 [Candidatus Woesearchaeota archaeon]|nr:hypothetical protein [Candidatus Woesearchaeota archaeon]